MCLFGVSVLLVIDAPLSLSRQDVQDFLDFFVVFPLSSCPPSAAPQARPPAKQREADGRWQAGIKSGFARHVRSS